MKLLFSFIFLLFSSLSFYTQAQVLIEYEIAKDMNQFDWSAFSNKANVQEHIDFRNQRFNLLGAKVNTITGLKWNKLDLVRIEQELGLYKQGIKTGLSAEMIQAAEKAIALYWESVNSIADQIKAQAGLAEGLVDVITPATPMVGKTEEYYNGAWELHKGDHEVVFNMVEKKDEALYKAFGENDEAYAEFIAPYVQKYMQKMGETAKIYYDSLGDELDYEMTIKYRSRMVYTDEYEYKEFDTTFKDFNFIKLKEIYLNSVEIYNCFTKNFKEPVGVNQQRLMNSIYDWHTNQALLAMNSRIEDYKIYGKETKPNVVAYSFFKFYDAPIEVKEKIGDFLRNDILNNEDFIGSQERFILKGRVNALIGLNYLGVATPEEQELYNKAIEQGVINYNSTHSFSGKPLPLPE